MAVEYVLCSVTAITCLMSLNHHTDAQGSGFSKMFWLVRNSKSVSGLVVLYAMSNLLAYFALARVDASAYTVLLQV